MSSLFTIISCSSSCKSMNDVTFLDGLPSLLAILAQAMTWIMTWKRKDRKTLKKRNKTNGEKIRKFCGERDGEKRSLASFEFAASKERRFVAASFCFWVFR